MLNSAKRALALGFFDAVHLGHAALLRRLVEVSLARGLTPTVISFDTLPQNLVSGAATELINSNDDRERLIMRSAAANACDTPTLPDIHFLPFDEKTAATPWDEFLGRLISEYSAAHFVVGDNFRFGKGAAGSSESLARRCFELGIGCDIIPDVLYDGVVCSSTYIRELLRGGELERANAFLGRPHTFTGAVNKGRQLGSQLGAPTINMSFDRGLLIPAHGVYATKVFSADVPVDTPDDMNGLVGVTNIGVRPTVDSSDIVTCETHIPGFDKNLYGRKALIEFHKFLRPEMKFPDIDALRAQIQEDCASALRYFTAN